MHSKTLRWVLFIHDAILDDNQFITAMIVIDSRSYGYAAFNRNNGPYIHTISHHTNDCDKLGMIWMCRIQYQQWSIHSHKETITSIVVINWGGGNMDMPCSIVHTDTRNKPSHDCGDRLRVKWICSVQFQQ